MKLIVISSEQSLPQEAMVINRLFEAGLTCFHLRKPEMKEVELRRLMEKIDPAFYSQIAWHQFHHLATEFGSKRFHFSEQARNQLTKGNSSTKSEGFIWSTSVHDEASFNELTNFDYSFFGPVFNSISKPGYQSTLPSNFQLVTPSTPIVALGGINERNIDQLKKMNFKGVAVLGAIWNSPELAIKQFETIQQKCSENVPLY